MATCNQKPARVLTILRSSTATRRPRPGRAWTPAASTRVGAARVVVLMRLLLVARSGTNRSASTERFRPAWSARRRGVRAQRRPRGPAGAGRRRRPSPAGHDAGVGFDVSLIALCMAARQAGAAKRGIEGGEVICLDDGPGLGQQLSMSAL